MKRFLLSCLALVAPLTGALTYPPADHLQINGHDLWYLPMDQNEPLDGFFDIHFEWIGFDSKRDAMLLHLMCEIRNGEEGSAVAPDGHAEWQGIRDGIRIRFTGSEEAALAAFKQVLEPNPINSEGFEKAKASYAGWLDEVSLRSLDQKLGSELRNLDAFDRRGFWWSYKQKLLGEISIEEVESIAQRCRQDTNRYCRLVCAGGLKLAHLLEETRDLTVNPVDWSYTFAGALRIPKSMGEVITRSHSGKGNALGVVNVICKQEKSTQGYKVRALSCIVSRIIKQWRLDVEREKGRTLLADCSLASGTNHIYTQWVTWPSGEALAKHQEWLNQAIEQLLSKVCDPEWMEESFESTKRLLLEKRERQTSPADRAMELLYLTFMGDNDLHRENRVFHAISNLTWQEAQQWMLDNLPPEQETHYGLFLQGEG